MAKEKFIEGKHDNGHHTGRMSNLKRLIESEEELIDFWRSVWPELWEAVEKGTLEPESHPLDKAPKQ